MTKSLWQRMTKRMADQWRNLPGQGEKCSRSKLTGIKVLYRCCISSLVLGHASHICLPLLSHSCMSKTDSHGWSAFKLAVFWQSPKGQSSDEALSVPATTSPKAQSDTLSSMGYLLFKLGFFAIKFFSYLLSSSWITSIYLFFKYECQQKKSTLL